jgi:dipeptidyl aminopeptidase/acylaminoacyl peptidase
MLTRSSLILVFLLSSLVVPAQESLTDLHRRADRFASRYGDQFYYGIHQLQAIEQTHRFWYSTRTPRGMEFFIIDAANQQLLPAFDAVRLAAELSKLTGREVHAYRLPFSSVRFNRELDSLFFEVGGTAYTCRLSDYEVTRRESRPRQQQRYWGGVNLENGSSRVKSPDGTREAWVVEGNIWINELKSNRKSQLSFDGSPGEYYSSSILWSPDSKKLVSSKFRPATVRKLLIIDSSPDDQLQPRTQEYDYPKPGDALAVRRPVAFEVETGRRIAFDIPEVELQYELNRIQWEPDSREFTFHFNRRGHQQYVVYAADVERGSLRAVIDERSATFVHYNQLYYHRLKAPAIKGEDKVDVKSKRPAVGSKSEPVSKGDVLWISERDGWRHLYLFDFASGKLKKQLTKGEWIVKRVVRVDEERSTVLFVGCGRDAGEDPYLEKYYRLDMKSGAITSLTPENAFHKATFSSDYRYMVDYYSRADAVPTLVVRALDEGGRIVFRPEQQPDISAAVADGWRMPEVFAAKGRDGQTDIWGLIIRPTDFDPAKKYPVVEYIYAGPHDSHVPKEFAMSVRSSGLSEMGFITVLIDGMGTANRSKAFHDVCWQNLKDAGFPDRIAWMKAAGARYPEMDLDRVGIYGGSAGGQNAAGALIFHPEFYKVAVSACGCHDNRMDKIWWNEQWMGYPVGRHYEESSNVVNAAKLKGKLMLILGELDNNVDPSSTLQLVDALIKYDKDFEFVMLPGVGHTLGEKFGEKKRREYFITHLGK